LLLDKYSQGRIFIPRVGYSFPRELQYADDLGLVVETKEELRMLRVR